MIPNPTIFLAGGGTGGHLYPGISVALALKERIPGVRCVFLCTNREIDRVILSPTGFEFLPQPIVPPVKSIGGLLRFFKSWRETREMIKRLVRESRPAAVLGLGGYAAGVAVKYCAEKRIPAAIINPDVIPGKANRFLMRKAAAVFCQFEQTREHVAGSQQGKIRVTGCPIRPELAKMPARAEAEAAARLGVEANLQTLVITGASQGAKTINEAMVAALPKLNLAGWQVLHLAGHEHAASVQQAYRTASIPARVIDFTDDIAAVMAVADVLVGRAGASTCAELTACGTPSILLPYPYHKDMHQRANARVLADAGAAILLEDVKDAARNAQALGPALESLMYSPEKRAAMSAAARRIGKPDAAEQVAAQIALLIGQARPSL